MTATIEPIKVLCVNCTRVVPAQADVEVDQVYRKARLVPQPGQKCSRCSASLDAAQVVR